MKRCSKCNLNQAKSLFSKRATAPDGLKPWCKGCDKKWYHRNKKRHISNVKKRNKRVIEEHRNIVWDYWKTHPCVDCGESDPMVLEFDHRNPSDKLKEISTLIRRAGSNKALLEEIAKCDIRCANCHSRRTAKQRNYWTYTRACRSIGQDSRLLSG